MGDSQFAQGVQGVIALALIVAAFGLAYIDPATRGELEGALTLGVGSVIGYFFSQRASAAGVHAATNGMSTAASLIAASIPGPAGPAGPKGPPGTPGAPGYYTAPTPAPGGTTGGLAEPGPVPGPGP
jgi:hypothetical protein